MRIAYIVSSLSNAGPIIVVHNLVQLMTSHGHYCKVYYFDDKIELNFHCDKERITFRSQIDFKKFNIIHTHGNRPDLYVFLKKPFRTSSIFISTIHGNLFLDKNGSIGNKLKSWINSCIVLTFMSRHDHYIFLTKFSAAHYQKWFSPRKIDYAYNSVIIHSDEVLSQDEMNEVNTFKEKSLLIGANCSLIDRKGIDIVIKAMPYLPDYKLFLVGDGPMRNELEKLAMNLKIKSRVYFAKYRAFAYRYLPYYDIYVIPSWNEGFPLAMLEAAYFKKKIVCSNLPIFKEIFTVEEVSMFDLENPISIVSAIKNALLDNRLGENVYSHFCKEYSPSCMYHTYEKLYQKYIDKISL